MRRPIIRPKPEALLARQAVLDARRPVAPDAHHAGSGRVMSELEAIAISRIELAGLPAPDREHRFAPPRRWRFDLAYLGAMVAVELEGGTWSGGRHTTGKGFDGDCRKYGEATVRGWRVIRCTRDMIEDGTMVELLRRALEVT